MMYKNDFVASIKSAGKILREHNTGSSPTVYLPFGSEFSILLKNLQNRKASVKVSIDGQDVLNDGTLILDSNETVDLERFITDNLNRGNKFKFIEKTAEISDFRGDRVDDGIVRIEYKFEQETIWKTYNHINTYYGSNINVGGGVLRSNSFDGGRVYGSSVKGIADQSILCCAVASASVPTTDSCSNYLGSISESQNDAGITVAGSESKQAFRHGSIGPLEYNSYVITLQIKGGVANLLVEKPITVNTMIQCKTCGKKNISNKKFCSNCGTAVNII
jgi:hypothetical protein